LEALNVNAHYAASLLWQVQAKAFGVVTVETDIKEKCVRIKLLASSNRLFDRIMIPEVKEALQDWVSNTNSHGILIGALVVGLYSNPRTTTDVDIIFCDDSAIPISVVGFKRIREHAFEHQATGVEVEVLSPEYLKIPESMYNKVEKTASLKEGILVPSVSAIVALKMMRSLLRDLGDIERILKENPTKTFDISEFHVPKEKWQHAKNMLDQNKTEYRDNIKYE
jgi:hypothetical protein